MELFKRGWAPFETVLLIYNNSGETVAIVRTSAMLGCFRGTSILKEYSVSPQASCCYEVCRALVILNRDLVVLVIIVTFCVLLWLDLWYTPRLPIKVCCLIFLSHSVSTYEGIYLKYLLAVNNYLYAWQ